MADFKHHNLRQRQRHPFEYTELQFVTGVKNYRSDRKIENEQPSADLKTSRLSQILKKWKRQTRSHAASVVAGNAGSPSRAVSCSALQSTTLRSCLSMSEQLLYSDGEGDEEDGDAFDESFSSPLQKSAGRRCAGPRSPMARHSPARTLSCPMLGSPLSSCTPFSNISFDEHMRSEEALELSCSQTLNSRGYNSKGSSPLKLNPAKQPSIPKGYVAVYVGEERKRFLVKASVVNHPLFGVLLDKAREEFGYQQKGPLNIPCDISLFRQIMLLVETNDSFCQNADHATILLHPNHKTAAKM